MLETVFLVGVVLLGACVGSFLNVIILRLPSRTFFSAGARSRCPKCGQGIRWYDNIPLVSWLLLLRGRARCCGQGISLRYPIVELLTATLLCLLWLRFVWGTGTRGLPFSPDALLLFLFLAYFLTTLIACTFIDIDHRILPDLLTKPAMVLGCLGSLVVPDWLAGELPLEGSSDVAKRVLASVVGLAAGLALTWSIRALASRVFRQEAMGLGDVKFMAAIGAFLGWEGAVITFFLGSLLGALYGLVHRWVTKEAKVFFGPFLAAGAGTTMFYKRQIIEFMTETWPSWQREARLSPVVLIFVAVICLLLLVGIIRRGRSHHKE